ncbi:T9SS type A sorting domain-containing protein [Hymenobacter sp. GOD-10R]|uniref:T9SS type A sorting domain-containing protein n=1 Tax=Hymenobacter sp. GOD-10R TaxID=3093922 RepID=UPI002D7709BE|nr:T9SS type A sorting domain-containing protein [Hymenobacter sp. GOD-10R]WRQ31836.1 T9SS type A sorting domain-containing protein [Hymenobacter sp. GOD-10R]
MKNVLLLFVLMGSLTARAQWVLQPFTFQNTIAPYPPNAATLHIVDAQTVWATSINQYEGYNIGSNEVAHTTNGGATWTVQTIPDMDFYYECVFGVVGLNASTALISTANGVGPGRILRTADGGATWTTRTTPAQFGYPDSYADFLLAFSPTEILCIGDPVAALGNHFEMYRSLDVGLTWVAVSTANMPVAQAEEYADINYKAQRLGDHLWFTTNKGRVYHSPDRGISWSVAQTSLTQAGSIAFRDVRNGLYYVPGEALLQTTDGGVTWTPVAVSGPVHRIVAAVPGTNNYLSVGQGTDAGTSYSRDNGATWTALETTKSHFDLAVLSPTVAWSAALNFTSTTRAGLGAYKLTSTVLNTASLLRLPAETLSASPNPSANGYFALKLAPGVRPESYTVTDALGRVVQTGLLPPSDLAQLDLSAQAPGLYTLLLHTSRGVAQQRLIRQ